MRTLLLALVCCTVATEARADISVPPLTPSDGPAAYRVRIVEGGRIPGYTMVAVWSNDAGPDPNREPAGASYAVLDDFARDDLRRVCAFPSDRIAPSLGGLGPPRLRDAHTQAGGLATGQAEADALLALFEADDVACATLTPPPDDPSLIARHVEGVEDAIRPVRIEGHTLELELVSVSFQILGQPPIVVPALPGHARPTLPPPAPRGCGCGLARTASPMPLAIGLVLAIVLSARRTSAARRALRLASTARSPIRAAASANSGSGPRADRSPRRAAR